MHVKYEVSISKRLKSYREGFSWQQTDGQTGQKQYIIWSRGMKIITVKCDYTFIEYSGKITTAQDFSFIFSKIGQNYV